MDGAIRMDMWYVKPLFETDPTPAESLFLGLLLAAVVILILSCYDLA